MIGETGPEDSQSSFRQLFDGRCVGVRRWSDFDRLLDVLQERPEGWYVYMVGHEVPGNPAGPTELCGFLQQVARLLRTEHAYDYCGIVYADDPAAPSPVKIYDPNNLGSSCGSSGSRVLPGWVLSRVAPEALDSAAPLPMGRRRWWRRLFPGITD